MNDLIGTLLAEGEKDRGLTERKNELQQETKERETPISAEDSYNSRVTDI